MHFTKKEEWRKLFETILKLGNSLYFPYKPLCGMSSKEKREQFYGAISQIKTAFSAYPAMGGIYALEEAFVSYYAKAYSHRKIEWKRRLVELWEFISPYIDRDFSDEDWRYILEEAKAFAVYGPKAEFHPLMRDVILAVFLLFDEREKEKQKMGGGKHDEKCK